MIKAPSLILILSLMLTSSYGVSNDRYREEDNKPIFLYIKEEPQKAKYTDAMLKGTGIGSLCGLWCAGIDIAMQGASFPITWPIAFLARKGLINPALDTYAPAEAPQYRDTINNAAWVSSWASYITAMALFGVYAINK